VMARHESLRFRVSWIALLITGLATLVFGLIVMVVRSSDEQYLRAIVRRRSAWASSVP